MKKKIYRTMCLTVITAVIAAAALIFGVYVSQSVGMIKNEVRTHAEFLSAYLDAYASPSSDADILKKIYNADSVVRVTLITRGGDVIFDNEADASKMENHLERPEIQEALKSGSGESSRYSSTLGSKIYCCALELSDGNILRIAKNGSSVLAMGMRVVPEIACVIALVCLISALAAGSLTRRIMKPINEIDFDNMENADVYPELKPFLLRIARKNEEKEKSEQIRREFSANVSHELRTPLTTISGYAQIIGNGMAKPEDMRGFGKKIEKEADRLILLINDIIRLSLLDETNAVEEPEIIELSEAADSVIFRLKDQAEKKNVSIFSGGAKAYVRGNATQVNEMLYNIIDNAIKYNKTGGRVVVFTGETPEGAVFSVKDTGIGIPEEDKERIFERFYRVDKSHSKTVGGTGLGLSIVKHAAIAHNAKITVESSLGKGTQISVSFPPVNSPALPE